MSHSESTSGSRPYTVHRFRAVARPVGLLVAGLAVMMLVCAPAGLIMGSPEGASHMGTSAILTASLAALLLLIGRRAEPGEIGRREALLVVTSSWVLASLVGAVPFVIGAELSWFEAIFESTSGFTTTGATILPEISERLSHSLHLWRVLSHWLGGMGIVVLFVAVFPALGVGGRHLFHTEAAGPRSKGLSPRIKERSAMLWRAYLVLTLIELCLLMVSGLNPFDSLIHALSTMGTGGFSNLNGSVGQMHNPAAEWIILVFMLIGGMNFGLIQPAIRSGPRTLLRHTETKAYFLIFGLIALLVALTTWQSDIGVHDTVRNASFQVAAIMTTTGLSTYDYELWPAFAQLMIFILYFIGGSSGSTAGGVKVIRILILFRAAKAELARSFRPHVVHTIRVGREAVSPETLREVIAFCALFGVTVLGGAIAVALLDPVEPQTALIASLACVANVGPGFDLVGPTDNYGFFSGGSQLVLSTCMLLGRLELVTVLALLVPSFWKR
ncbi:MAG: TrkH family potassium uptake protein [Myxococcota bacterium]|nr:TrkH family potassium uptake protein [Myxococcota bacterium]